MIRLLRLFEAERIKWRWNWATALAVITPFSQVLFLFIFYWFLEERLEQTWSGFPDWYQINGNAWNLFFMPIMAAFIPSISWDLEEAAGRRRGLFLQPCSCVSHYVVKLASHLSLILFSQILFFILLYLAGITLRHFVPLLRMGPAHGDMFFRLAGASTLACLPLIALQTWVSANFKGLMVSLVTAVAGTWATTQLVGFVLLNLSPWGLATRAVAISTENQGALLPLALGAALCAVLLAIIGAVDFHRRGKSFT